MKISKKIKVEPGKKMLVYAEKKPMKQKTLGSKYATVSKKRA